MGRSEIRGEQVKDESIDSADIASGSIKAGELSEESVSGQALITATDVTNDRLLIWDATDSALKQVSIGNLGVTAAAAGSDGQVQYNDGGSTMGGTSGLYWDDINSRLGIGTTSPEAYLDIKNTTNDGATNRTMIQMYNYRADDADENDWAPTSIDFKIENVAGGVKGATARIATVLAPIGTNHNSTEGEKSSALIFSTMDDATLAESMRINNVGYVGIGTDDPDYALDVAGDIGINEYIYHNGDADTFIRLEVDKINIEAGGENMIYIVEGSGGAQADKVTINNDLADVDFQVKGASEADLIRTDAANDRVGIGTSSPGYRLHIASDSSAVVLIDGAAGSDAFLRFGQGGTLKSYIKQGSGGNLVITNETGDKDIILNIKDDTTTREGLRINGDVAEVVVNEGSDSLVDFRVESNSNTHMLYVDGSSNNVGIGTSNPSSILNINGPIATAISTKTSDYTVTASDSTILADASSTSVVITLPAVAGCTGRIYTVKCTDKSVGSAMSITTSGSETIDGSTDDAILDAFGAVTLQSDGSGWHKIAEIVPPPP